MDFYLLREFYKQYVTGRDSCRNISPEYVRNFFKKRARDGFGQKNIEIKRFSEF